MDSKDTLYAKNGTIRRRESDVGKVLYPGNKGKTPLLDLSPISTDSGCLENEAEKTLW